MLNGAYFYASKNARQMIIATRGRWSLQHAGMCDAVNTRAKNP
jgi:hypothetical protein